MIENETLMLSCPTLNADLGDRITLAHGEGGRLMRQLIQRVILPRLDNAILRDQGDAAVLPVCNGRPVLTTDSFVVSPPFFPGGDIGSLAVFGTTNDLTVAGARPLWITLSLILEEGLPFDLLNKVLDSVALAASISGVRVVAGDTKVVPRGAADGLFITTTGLGELIEPSFPGPTALEEGDVILVSGPIGDHGVAVLSAREGFQFDPPPKSDLAPLWDAVEALRSAHVPIRALRDATRGGVGAVLHEWADASEKTLVVDEASVPVSDIVRGVCELLGLDPLRSPNEGTMVAAIPQESAGLAWDVLRNRHSAAAAIGRVQSRSTAPVVIRRGPGIEIPLDEPLGAPLPRIC